MKKKRQFIVLCALFLLFMVSPVVHEAEELSPEARESFNKGLAAVNQQEWQIAIRYFLKAQEKAPDAPEVLFNLGLAESKVPGRELRSIVWFRAYLAKAPNTVSADAVRKEIASLEIRVEATIDKLINQTKQLVAQANTVSRWDHYCDIAIMQARTGDISGAKQTAAKATNSALQTFLTDRALGKIAAIQYYSGDAAGAENTIREISCGNKEVLYYNQSLAHAYIAYLQAIGGDFSKAEASIEKEGSDPEKAMSYLALAYEEALAGRRDQAVIHIAKALDIDKSLDKEDQKIQLTWVTEIQVYLGDIVGAKKTYLLERERSGTDSKPDNFAYLQSRYAESDIKRMAEFQRTLGNPLSPDFIGDPQVLKVKLDKVIPSEKHAEWTRFLQDELNDELFTDQQSALGTIAGKATPDAIVSGMVKALDKITITFNETKILAR